MRALLAPTHVCMFCMACEYERLISYVSESIEMQTKKWNAKCDIVHKIVECVAYQMNEGKKTYRDFFVVIVVFSLFFFLSSVIEIKQSHEKEPLKLTNEVENPTVLIITLN